MKAEALKPSPMPKEVGIWIRVSTEDQAKGESPEHHEKRARLRRIEGLGCSRGLSPRVREWQIGQGSSRMSADAEGH